KGPGSHSRPLPSPFVRAGKKDVNWLQLTPKARRVQARAGLESSQGPLIGRQRHQRTIPAGDKLMMANMELTGRSIIGFRRGTETGETLRGVSPATGKPIEPAFQSASSNEVDVACRLAATAFERYGRLAGRARAGFLRQIAQNIESLGDRLVER